MREIKFRAKRIDTGTWVYGQYFKTPLTDENSGESPDKGWFFLSNCEPKHCIVQNMVAFVIDVSTLGQYIGINDRNKKEMYEKDIVSFNDALDGKDSGLPERVGIIGYSDASFRIEREISNHYRWMDYDCEVIGNIIDNPELLY